MVLPKPVGFAHKKKDYSMDICAVICAGLCVLPFPIIQIVYSYNNPVVCDTNKFPFSINLWLYVESGFTISVFLYTVFILSLSKTKKIESHTLIYNLAIVFQLAWLIVGSVQFWRDCPYIEPKSVNIIMWITLIFGFVRFIGNNGVINR